VLLFALFSVLVILVAIWADLNFNWTGYGFVNAPLTQGQAVDRHKTIWDWMDLLIIPAVLAIGAIYINQAERRNESRVAKERIEEERKIAAKSAEDAALETYLKQMSELLIDQGLRATEVTDEKRTVARAWTLRPNMCLTIT
jgi:hypothetical protein